MSISGVKWNHRTLLKCSVHSWSYMQLLNNLAESRDEKQFLDEDGLQQNASHHHSRKRLSMIFDSNESWGVYPAWRLLRWYKHILLEHGSSVGASGSRAHHPRRFSSTVMITLVCILYCMFLPKISATRGPGIQANSRNLKKTRR